jgi:hypothetical protein
MPYRVLGLTVQVKKGGVWRKLKTHTSVEKAKEHLVALKVNVEEK